MCPMDSPEAISLIFSRRPPYTERDIGLQGNGQLLQPVERGLTCHLVR